MVQCRRMFVTVITPHAPYNLTVRTTHSTAKITWLPAYDNAHPLHYVLWYVLFPCSFFSLNLRSIAQSWIILLDSRARMLYTLYNIRASFKAHSVTRCTFFFPAAVLQKFYIFTSSGHTVLCRRIKGMRRQFDAPFSQGLLFYFYKLLSLFCQPFL